MVPTQNRNLCREASQVHLPRLEAHVSLELEARSLKVAFVMYEEWCTRNDNQFIHKVWRVGDMAKQVLKLNESVASLCSVYTLLISAQCLLYRDLYRCYSMMYTCQLNEIEPLDFNTLVWFRWTPR